MKKSHIALLVVFLVLITDQAIKIWVKTSFFIGEERPVIGNWFLLHFTENEGMAFGMELGGENGKLILSLFRLVACVFITIYLVKLIRKNAHTGLVVSIALILAGAAGNIIDSMVYGKLFSLSGSHSGMIAEFLPVNGGYASLLHGKVVDMLYFPLYRGELPGWIPVWGGRYFEFFRPVFNIADSSISCGVFAIIIFQRRFFPKRRHEADSSAGSPQESEATSHLV